MNKHQFDSEQYYKDKEVLYDGCIYLIKSVCFETRTLGLCKENEDPELGLKWVSYTHLEFIT